MSNVTFIIFPHTLFASLIPATVDPKQVQHIILLEEPTLIYHPKLRPIRVNKNKIALFRASLKWYYDTINQVRRSFPNLKSLTYIDYKTALKNPKRIQSLSNAHAWDPTDDVIRAHYKNITFHESPMFLLSSLDLSQINTTRHADFYKHIKQHLNVLPTTKSYDAENRNALPPSLNSPPHPEYNTNQGNLTSYYDEAITYANSTTFKQHVGDPTNLRYSPINHSTAAQHLEYFIKKRFEHFGPYQDAVRSQDTILFHANISHLLNNGLLEPKQVLHAVLAAASKAAKAANKIPIQSLEGFVRQLIGWREYMRYIYERHKPALSATFRPSSPYRIEATTWRTGIPAIDTEIEKAIATGYAHHIVRLMWFLNFMKLAEIPAHTIYTWFSEVVSLDAYDWVMYSNIGAMGYYTTPSFMQKPYLSTSAYIQKMSDYKERSETWDALFYNYLKNHEAELTGGAAIYTRNLAMFKRFPKEKQERYIKLAQQVVNNLKKEKQ